MSNEMYEKGLQIRREVLGDAYVDRAIGSADDFNRDFQAILTEYCWGAVWGRPGLSRTQRSLNNICMLSALGPQPRAGAAPQGRAQERRERGRDQGDADPGRRLLRRAGRGGSVPHCAACARGARPGRRPTDADTRLHRPRQHGRADGAQSRRCRPRGGVPRRRGHGGTGAARRTHGGLRGGGGCEGPHRLPLPAGRVGRAGGGARDRRLRGPRGRDRGGQHHRRHRGRPRGPRCAGGGRHSLRRCAGERRHEGLEGRHPRHDGGGSGRSVRRDRALHPPDGGERPPGRHRAGPGAWR